MYTMEIIKIFNICYNILERINEDCLQLLEEEDDIDDDFALKNILYMTKNYGRNCIGN